MTGKHIKKPEYSKIISMIAIVLWVAVNLYGLIMMAITLELSPLMYVIGSVDAVVAVVYAVYSHKAKSENKIKLTIALIEALIKLKVAYGEDAAFVIRNTVGAQNSYCDIGDDDDSSISSFKAGLLKF